MQTLAGASVRSSCPGDKKMLSAAPNSTNGPGPKTVPLMNRGRARLVPHFAWPADPAGRGCGTRATAFRTPSVKAASCAPFFLSLFAVMTGFATELESSRVQRRRGTVPNGRPVESVRTCRRPYRAHRRFMTRPGSVKPTQNASDTVSLQSFGVSMINFNQHERRDIRLIIPSIKTSGRQFLFSVMPASFVWMTGQCQRSLVLKRGAECGAGIPKK
jgi:hypothetical protein